MYILSNRNGLIDIINRFISFTSWAYIFGFVYDQDKQYDVASLCTLKDRNVYKSDPFTTFNHVVNGTVNSGSDPSCSRNIFGSLITDSYLAW